MWFLKLQIRVLGMTQNFSLVQTNVHTFQQFELGAGSAMTECGSLACAPKKLARKESCSWLFVWSAHLRVTGARCLPASRLTRYSPWVYARAWEPLCLSPRRLLPPSRTPAQCALQGENNFPRFARPLTEWPIQPILQVHKPWNWELPISSRFSSKIRPNLDSKPALVKFCSFPISKNIPKQNVFAEIRT